jgi:hypothetical protein
MARVISLRAFAAFATLPRLGAGALGVVGLVAVAAAGISLAQGCSVGVVSGNFATGDGGFGGDDGGSSSGGASGDATTCQPGDVRTFAPPAYTPASPLWQDACSVDQLTQAFNACIDPTNPASTATCAAFSDPDASTGSCAACLITSSTAAAFGPFVRRGSYVAENASGCIELTNPGPGGLTCAKAQQALDGCELAACAAFCPAYDNASSQVLSCMKAAAAGGCQMFAQQASCASTVAEAGRAAQCTGLSLHDFFWSVAPLFCGDAPDGAVPLRDGSPDNESSDAGDAGDASGSTDASADAGSAHDAGGDASADATTSDALVPEGAPPDGPSSDAAADALLTTDGQAEAATD